MIIGDKLFAIKDKKIVEYTVSQIVTTETAKGKDVETFIQNSGMHLAVKRMDINDLKDYFKTKEEAQKVLDIIKKYI